MRYGFAIPVLLLAILLATCKPPQKMSAPVDGDADGVTALSWETPPPPKFKPKPPPPRSDRKLLQRFESKSMADILSELVPSVWSEDHSQSNSTPNWETIDGDASEFDGSSLFVRQAVDGLLWSPVAGVVADLDGDTNLDVVALVGDGSAIRVFMGQNLKPGALAFVRKTDSGLEESVGGVALAAVDFDSDSDTDLMVLRGDGLPSSLLRNGGDGKFEDVTVASGLLDFRTATHCLWADFDGNGSLDVFLVNDGADERCGLYLADSKGGFSDRAHTWGIRGRGGETGGVALLDCDGDGWLDVVISGKVDDEKSVAGCYRNTAGKRFDKIALPAKMSAGPLQVADLDEDGREDLLAFDGGRWRWWRNMSSAKNSDRFLFDDLTGFAGLEKLEPGTSPELVVADFDGDGDRDLLGGDPLRLLLNRRGDRFVDSADAGVHLTLGTAPKSWLAVGDFDRDGDADVIDDGHLLLSRASENAGWVRLQGGPELAGSALTVTVRDAGWIQSAVHRRIGADGTVTLPLGLGETETIVRIEIRRPGEAQWTTVKTDVPLNETIQLQAPKPELDTATTE